jgi:hypothetical protein
MPRGELEQALGQVDRLQISPDNYRATKADICCARRYTEGGKSD